MGEVISIKKLNSTEKMVEQLLTKYPKTRDNDHLLYRAYHYELKQRGEVKADFVSFFTYPEKYNASNFATIERCRRKVQQYKPSLANKVTKLNREYLQEVFKSYGTSYGTNGGRDE